MMMEKDAGLPSSICGPAVKYRVCSSAACGIFREIEKSFYLDTLLIRTGKFIQENNNE